MVEWEESTGKLSRLQSSLVCKSSVGYLKGWF